MTSERGILPRRLTGIALLVAPWAVAPAQSRFERVSVDSNGVEANNRGAYVRVAFAAGGRHVAFDSLASNLAPWDLNNTSDVFVRDRSDAKTVLISLALTGLSGNRDSQLGGISADGRFVAFTSSSDNLVKYDTNSQQDVFVRDRDPAGDGIFDEGDETTVRVSVDGAGVQANGSSYAAAISGDGTTVVFTSDATNLVGNDTNDQSDIFVHDLVTGATTRVSVANNGAQANGGSFEACISDDGSLVAFQSTASNLVKLDRNGSYDLFLRDRVAGTTERLSIASDGSEANNSVQVAALSGDGQRAVFTTYADNLVANDKNNAPDVFLRDRAAGTTTRVSVSMLGIEADNGSYDPRISRDGGFVVFGSAATNLAGIETNHVSDVFELEVATGVLRKLSVHPSGAEGTSESFSYGVSDDGQLVALIENATDLIGSDANGVFDLLLRDVAVADPLAAASSYGAGWPGTNGVPSLAASAPPVMGTTIDVAFGNSLGFWAVGFLVMGQQQAALPMGGGGTLLVVPTVVQPLLVGPAGGSFGGAVPIDDALAGVDVFLQMIEVDAGAVGGLSFSPGLDLLLGQ